MGRTLRTTRRRKGTGECTLANGVGLRLSGEAAAVLAPFTVVLVRRNEGRGRGDTPAPASPRAAPWATPIDDGVHTAAARGCNGVHCNAPLVVAAIAAAAQVTAGAGFESKSKSKSKSKIMADGVTANGLSWWWWWWLVW